MPATTLAAAPAAGGPLQRLLALPQKSRVVLAGAAVLLAGLLAVSLLASREPEWRVLYAGLADKDGGAVIAALTQLNVPHRFSEGGGAILVPADKVHDARLKLASQGLPRGGTVGFELMENQKFGATQFQERLNFQRGLEGELARSIMALAAVQSARVHLALPNQTAFLREQQKPSASVLLTLYNGRTLERAQVAGIVHLVASSVPELQAKSVSVVDQTGALLSQAEGEAGGGLEAPQLQYVRQAERDLSQRIVGILEPIVGAGNVRAQVTADMDFTQSESTAELYAPNQGSAPAAVRSQHLSEAPSAAGVAGGGVPGALSNQPPATPTSPVNGAPQAIGPLAAGAATGAGAGVRRDAVTNYEVDKTVKVVRNATGTIRRLSAAVLVNHVAPAGADGKPGKAGALPEAQMQQLNALVREAIGFSKERGDSVQVVNAAFSGAGATPAELPLWRQPETLDAAVRLARWLAVPLAALIVILGFVRPALRAARQAPARVLDATVQDPIALAAPPAAAPLAGLTAPPATALLPDAQEQRRQDRATQLEGIRQLARQDPATVANVVRNWAST
nr:flagellar basal-body MS-ring/collar protein FliF [Ramlibacter alkalitolerans]